MKLYKKKKIKIGVMELNWKKSFWEIKNEKCLDKLNT